MVGRKLRIDCLSYHGKNKMLVVQDKMRLVQDAGIQSRLQRRMQGWKCDRGSQTISVF